MSRGAGQSKAMQTPSARGSPEAPVARPEPAPLPAQRVRLNVGGSVFETTESTLTKVDCYFAALFRGSYASAGEEEGICGVREFFIDRDPTHFRFILNFLRDGVVVMPHSQEALEEIAREAHFYQLGHLERLVRKRLAELRAEESARPSHEREFKVLRHVPESNLESRVRELAEQGYDFVSGLPSSSAGNLHLVFAKELSTADVKMLRRVMRAV